LVSLPSHNYNIATPANKPPAIAPITPGTFTTAAPVLCAGADADAEDVTEEDRETEADVERDDDSDEDMEAVADREAVVCTE
jgi:hypothetical protein